MEDVGATDRRFDILMTAASYRHMFPASEPWWLGQPQSECYAIGRKIAELHCHRYLELFEAPRRLNGLTETEGM